MKLFNIIKHLVLISVIAIFIYKIHYLFLFNYSYFNIGFIVSFLFCVGYYNYIFNKAWFDFLERRREYKEELDYELGWVKEFVSGKFKYDSIRELERYLGSIQKNVFCKETLKLHKKDIDKKMTESLRLLDELKHKEKIEGLKQEQQEISTQIIDLKKEKRMITNKEEAELEDIKENLNIEEETVFYGTDLEEKELEVLKKEGYSQSNEYSIFSNQNETVLIKPILNHSNTHIFLSYEIKELLESLEMDNIQEHLTRDADITFKHKNKYYAIEIETGNLLKKKEQLKEKIDYLNKKYKNRWIFVVTNKNLVSEYKKHGFTTQRSQVKKTLEKWLKIDTQ